MAMATQESTQPSPVMWQIGMLNLRINDIMTQLNPVMKALVDENGALNKRTLK